MLELIIFRHDLIHFLFNKAHQRLDTGYQLAGMVNWNASLLTIGQYSFYYTTMLHFNLTWKFYCESVSLCFEVELYIWEKIDYFSSSFLLDFGLSFPTESEKFTPCNLFSAFLSSLRQHRLSCELNSHLYFLNSQENSDPPAVC